MERKLQNGVIIKEENVDSVIVVKRKPATIKTNGSQLRAKERIHRMTKQTSRNPAPQNLIVNHVKTLLVIKVGCNYFIFLKKSTPIITTIILLDESKETLTKSRDGDKLSASRRGDLKRSWAEDELEVIIPQDSESSSQHEEVEEDDVGLLQVTPGEDYFSRVPDEVILNVYRLVLRNARFTLHSSLPYLLYIT